MKKVENINKITNELPKAKHYILKKIIITIFLLFIIGCDIIIYLLYGPWYGFRDWLITTAMTTFSHQYLATWFYSNEAIQESLNRNRIEQVTGSTDESLINIINYNQIHITSYKNDYERQILEKKENNNDYKILSIDGGKDYHGYMAVIYDSSRVEVATSAYLDKDEGELLTDISKRTNALVAINAGGFSVSHTEKVGGQPTGITISNNNIISYNDYSNIIGFNKNNKLILGNLSTQEAKSKNIRDCISFSPNLIVNNQKSTVHGNGGWGKASRTAIGQRADGIVLFLVLEGERLKGNGATMLDLINILEKYGAVNAANLDGGTSTCMTVNNHVINDVTASGISKPRTIPTAFILKADDSDDGDYSVVKDKVDK